MHCLESSLPAGMVEHGNIYLNLLVYIGRPDSLHRSTLLSATIILQQTRRAKTCLGNLSMQFPQFRDLASWGQSGRSAARGNIRGKVQLELHL